MSLFWWFHHLSCSWAEICQIFRWFFGKFKKSKRYSEIIWPLGRRSLLPPVYWAVQHNEAKNILKIMFEFWSVSDFTTFMGWLLMILAQFLKFFYCYHCYFLMLCYHIWIQFLQIYHIQNSSNEIRKTKNEHLIIVCQNLIVL